MNFTAEYLRKATNEDGDMELTLKLNSYYDQEIIKDLQKETPYRISCNQIKSKRSLEQNKLLWAIIREINVAMGTERDSDDWDIYIRALERAGAKYEYIAVLPEGAEILKEKFRAVQKMNSFEHNGHTFDCYKVFYGSSKMNSKEMTLLIDTLMDMAEEVGIHINDPIDYK